jgi:protein gp37
VADGTGIAWTDATWNPLRGCSRVSEGCRFCYAEGVAARFSGPGLPYEGLARSTPQGPRWTGKIRLVPEVLDQPLRWRRPRRIFVNSMSDLFHEDVPFAFIDRVFAVMALSYWHTFQVLTKRPARMRELLTRWAESRLTLRDGYGTVLPNVCLGVSVEDQRAADERIPELLGTPAAVRFLSCEPLLERVSLFAFLKGQHRDESLAALRSPPMPGLDLVIAGGESGPGARPCDVSWIRSLVAQCREAHVPAFVKQLGAHVIDRNDAGWDGVDPTDWPSHLEAEDRIEHDEADTGYQGAPVRVRLRDRKGGDPAEWPEDLRVREMPEVRHE